jgi:TonB family protein
MAVSVREVGSWICLYAAYVVLASRIGSVCLGGQGPREISLPEASLRKLALKVVMPPYPRDAEAGRITGVVVAQVVVSEEGTVAEASVLQAPADSIKKVVPEAVRQWRFKAQTVGGAPVRVHSKLTFYYLIDSGKGVVRNPEQMPQKN